MNALKILFKNTFKMSNIVYFIVGASVISFKYISKWQIGFGFLLLIFIINILKIILKPKLAMQIFLAHLNWIFLPLSIYVWIFEYKIIGFLMITHLFSDNFAKIIRQSIKPLNNRYFPKNLNGTIIFILSYYILCLAYSFFLHNGLLKKYIFIFLINSIYFSLLENGVKIKDFPDNFNINIFGAIFLFLSLTVDIKLRMISSNLIQNVIFGLIWCIIPIFILIILDIINLKKGYLYYVLFLLLYVGLGYRLFLFNILILLIIGLIKKIEQSHAVSAYSSFLNINELKKYYLLSFILALTYFFLPFSKKNLSIIRILRSSAAIGLISALLHYFYTLLNDRVSKHYISFKKGKISREIILFNLAITFFLLLTAYFLNLIGLNLLVYALLMTNIFMVLYILLNIESIYKNDNKVIQFLIPYISFKTFFLIQII